MESSQELTKKLNDAASSDGSTQLGNQISDHSHVTLTTQDSVTMTTQTPDTITTEDIVQNISEVVSPSVGSTQIDKSQCTSGQSSRSDEHKGDNSVRDDSSGELIKDTAHASEETNIEESASELNIKTAIGDGTCIIQSKNNLDVKDSTSVASDEEPPTKRSRTHDNLVDSIEQRSEPFHAEDEQPQTQDISSMIGPVLPPHLKKMETVDEDDNTLSQISCMQLQTSAALVTSTHREFMSPDNYLRGCKWSPDGSCLLTNSNDNTLRLYNLPEPLYDKTGVVTNKPPMESVLRISENDTIYDFCWYPEMSSANPETSCLVSTCKDNPVHLWDAYTGELRCTYRPYNHLDEICAAHSLSFNLHSTKLYCGFNKMIKIFDLDRPGRQCETRQTYKKVGQPGIISCMAHSSGMTGVYAAGSFSRGIALYSESSGDMICMFQGQVGGVTHIAFSPDGNKLYSGGRKDSEIICWDLRHPGHILFVAVRDVQTNQRIYFDQDRSGRYLISGSHDGCVYVWDTTESPVESAADPVLQHTFKFQAHQDTVNGVSLHPDLPLLATASGQRHYPDLGGSEDSDSEETDTAENSVKLWWLF